MWKIIKISGRIWNWYIQNVSHCYRANFVGISTSTTKWLQCYLLFSVTITSIASSVLLDQLKSTDIYLNYQNVPTLTSVPDMTQCYYINQSLPELSEWTGSTPGTTAVGPAGGGGSGEFGSRVGANGSRASGILVYKFSPGDKIRISRNFALIVSTHSIISSLQIHHSHLLYVTYCRHSQSAVNSA